MSLRQKPFYIVFIRFPTWFSGPWKPATAIKTIILTVSFHNLYNSVTRDKQTTSETHRFPWEGSNSVEIFGGRKVNWCEQNLAAGVGTIWSRNRIDSPFLLSRIRKRQTVTVTGLVSGRESWLMGSWSCGLWAIDWWVIKCDSLSAVLTT